MKNMIFVLAAVCMYQTTAMAQEVWQNRNAFVACSDQIVARVQRLAAHNGYSDCTVGKPELAPGLSLRIEKGSVAVQCPHHVSAISTTEVFVDYSFAVPDMNGQGPDCSQVSVSALSTLPPEQVPPEQIRPVISGSNIE